jgi:hypothetical protein
MQIYIRQTSVIWHLLSYLMSTMPHLKEKKEKEEKVKESK